MKKASGQDVSAASEARFRKAQKLQLELKSLKNSFDPRSKSLRDQLRSLYESILLSDHDFSDSHDVEDLIWRLHYKRIEEFRAILRKHPTPSRSPAFNGTSTNPQSPALTQLQKLQSSFRSFLSESSNFYHELLSKLKAAYGLPPDFPFLEPLSPAQAKCQASCQRCLVFLGDLARYKELHTENSTGGSRDYGVAASYYLQAASTFPNSGHAHNQLAVLALYSQDKLLALYRYCRSLASVIPFATTRENLSQLFESNRALLPPMQELSADDPQYLFKLKTSFYARFINVCGLILTEINLETFPTAMAQTLSDLTLLLGLESTAGDPFSPLLAPAWGKPCTGPGATQIVGGPLRLLQMCTSLIFALHQSSAGSVSPKLGVQEGREVLLVVGAKLLEALSAVSGDWKAVGLSALSPGVNLLLTWIAWCPEIVLSGGEEQETGTEAALSLFLRAVAGLALRLDGALPAGAGPVQKCLWEDYELRGFVPLSSFFSAQEQGFFSVPVLPPAVGSSNNGSEQEGEARVSRLLQAALRLHTYWQQYDERVPAEEDSLLQEEVAVTQHGAGEDSDEDLDTEVILWATDGETPLIEENAELQEQLERERLQLRQQQGQQGGAGWQNIPAMQQQEVSPSLLGMPPAELQPAVAAELQPHRPLPFSTETLLQAGSHGLDLDLLNSLLSSSGTGSDVQAAAGVPASPGLSSLSLDALSGYPRGTTLRDLAMSLQQGPLFTRSSPLEPPFKQQAQPQAKGFGSASSVAPSLLWSSQGGYSGDRGDYSWLDSATHTLPPPVGGLGFGAGEWGLRGAGIEQEQWNGFEGNRNDFGGSGGQGRGKREGEGDSFGVP